MSRRSEQGFTLLELLVSIAILAFMMVLAWGTVSNTALSKSQMEQVNQRTHELRVAMSMMVRDLSHAYVSANEDQNINNPRTLFVGDSAEYPLRFSSMAHRTLWADADESEQTLIAYRLVPDPELPGITSLMRRESRRLSNEQWDREPADKEILLRDVEKIEFEYWDWRDDSWKERWNTTQADAQKGRLPSRVKITLTANLPGGRETVLTTQARLELQEQLQFFAN